MRIVDYLNLITETVAQLQELEKREKDVRVRLRVQLLRLLKSGEVRSMKEACRFCGITPKHGYELWGKYRDQGLSHYLKLNWKPRVSKLTPAEQQKLLADATSRNGFSAQSEVLDYVQKEFGVSYTQGGISLLFQRLKIKAKEPRPKNWKASLEKQVEYKKTLPEA